MSPPDPPPQGSEHILLVKDEPELAEAVHRGLEGLGYRVTAFLDDERALEALADALQAHDLLLTDLMLPGMKGADSSSERVKCIPNSRWWSAPATP